MSEREGDAYPIKGNDNKAHINVKITKNNKKLIEKRLKKQIAITRV